MSQHRSRGLGSDSWFAQVGCLSIQVSFTWLAIWKKPSFQVTFTFLGKRQLLCSCWLSDQAPTSFPPISTSTYSDSCESNPMFQDPLSSRPRYPPGSPALTLQQAPLHTTRYTKLPEAGHAIAAGRIGCECVARGPRGTHETCGGLNSVCVCVYVCGVVCGGAGRGGSTVLSVVPWKLTFFLPCSQVVCLPRSIIRARAGRLQASSEIFDERIRRVVRSCSIQEAAGEEGESVDAASLLSLSQCAR